MLNGILFIVMQCFFYSYNKYISFFRFLTMRHRIWALVLVLLLVFPSTRSAGVEPLDKSVVKQAERHLLAMFGLEARPTPTKSNKTVSNYVKELYEKQRKLASPDTIRSFKGRGKLLSNCISSKCGL